MKRADLDGGVELEYKVEGSGPPVLLIHGSFIADGLSLLRKTSFSKRYRLISYNRQGFAGSTHPNTPLSMSHQAADSRNLMAFLNIEKAHVVGHSFGANIAVQLALDHPDRVYSLSLLEGGLPFEAIFPKAVMEQFGQQMMRVSQIYQKGDKSGAIEAYLRFVVGPDVKATLDRLLPGAYEQAARDADTFFQVELPALRSWSLTSLQTRSINKPILNAMGEKTNFVEAAKEVETKVTEWFPHAERVWIPRATHFSQLSNLEGLSEALDRFFTRHALET